MDINIFYAVTSAACCTPVGLWWLVVKDRADWFKDEAKKRLAGGVHASFLIPARMSSGARVSRSNSGIWQIIFIIVALTARNLSSKLINPTRTGNPKDPFSKNSWVMPALLMIVLVLVVFPDPARIVAMQRPQMEGLIFGLLILCMHMPAWEFLTFA